MFAMTALVHTSSALSLRVLGVPSNPLNYTFTIIALQC